jgi:hypothetical protein
MACPQPVNADAAIQPVFNPSMPEQESADRRRLAGPPSHVRRSVVSFLVGGGQAEGRSVRRIHGPPTGGTGSAVRVTGVTEYGRADRLAPENLTTLAHLSVSSAMSWPKSAGEPASVVPPKSASRAFILGSVSTTFISLLSVSDQFAMFHRTRFRLYAPSPAMTSRLFIRSPRRRAAGSIGVPSGRATWRS